jgi:hypothetical protein
MGKRQCDILPKQIRMRLWKRWIENQPSKSRQIFVRQELGGFDGEKSGGHQHVELLSPVETEHGADAVKNVAANPSIARFQPAQRAVVNLCEIRNLFLCQSAIGAEPYQQAAQIFAGS